MYYLVEPLLKYFISLVDTYFKFSCVVQEEYKPPLKLKLSRKDGSRESPCFEINKPIISSLLRPGWIELQKLARQQQQAALLSSSPSSHARHSFSPPPQLASPKEAGSPAIRLIPAGVVGGRAAYSPISSPDLSTRSSPPPPVLLSPPLRSSADSGAVVDRPPSPAGKKAPRPRKGTVLAAESNTLAASSEPTPQPQEVSDPPGSAEMPSDRGGRGPSRGRRLLACPLCGAEYALATTLEKHIDRDHKEENAPAPGGRRTKRASRSADRSPTKKRKTASSEGLAASITSADGGSSVAESVDRPKLTEYEIFQSLQLPADRKTVACTLCGQLMPPNTLKRHLARYVE